MSARVRVCSLHGSPVESFSAGRFLCPSKTGPKGHPQHVVADLETSMVDAAASASAPAPAAKPQPKARESKLLLRWKAGDGTAILWLRAVNARKVGDAYALQWQVIVGEKSTQGIWATAPDEQKARALFDAEVAKAKTAGWKEKPIGVVGRLVLTPVPAPNRKGAAR